MSFPTDNPYYNIVAVIQNLILLYFHPRFQLESTILTDEEQTIFRDLWIDNHKLFVDNEWKLIHKGSTNGFDEGIFRDRVNGLPQIIFLVELRNGNVFGGYTKTGWSKSQYSGHSADKDAFVFQIRSTKGYKPFISNVKQDEESISTALGYHSIVYGIFGANKMKIIGITSWSYPTPLVDHDMPGNYAECQHKLPFTGLQRSTTTN